MILGPVLVSYVNNMKLYIFQSFFFLNLRNVKMFFVKMLKE